MDKAGTHIVGDMIARKERDMESVVSPMKRVGAHQTLKFKIRNLPPAFVASNIDTCLLEYLTRKLVRQDQLFTNPSPISFGRRSNFVETVFDLWGERDRAVSWYRPWSRGPNNHRRLVE